MNPWAKSCIGLLALLSALALLGKYVGRAPVSPPPRPESVPPDAVWLGINKGDWFQCLLMSNFPNVVNCTIYNDAQGEKISSGPYEWKPDDGQNTVLVRVPRLKSYDGRVIGAQGGRLMPIGTHIFYLSASEQWRKEYPSVDR